MIVKHPGSGRVLALLLALDERFETNNSSAESLVWCPEYPLVVELSWIGVTDLAGPSSMVICCTLVSELAEP
jgi:hypothetical protein